MPSTSKPSRARAHEPEGRVALSSSPACFEPFGEDWSNARSFGLNLRLPGQWDDAAWNNTQIASGLYYNLNRWYETQVGRYASPDPDRNAGMRFGYGLANPLRYLDPLGLFTMDGSCGEFECTPSGLPPGRASQMSQQVQANCGLLFMIADVSLRECLDDSCKFGVIRCEKCPTRPGKGGWNPATRPSDPVNHEAIVCSNMVRPKENPASRFNLGWLVFHEWGHGCGRERYRDHDPYWDPFDSPGRQ